MLIFIHGDPTIKGSPDRTISALEQQSGGFLVGGLSSSRGENIQIAHNVVNGGFSGVAFSDNIEVATAPDAGVQNQSAFRTPSQKARVMSFLS